MPHRKGFTRRDSCALINKVQKNMKRSGVNYQRTGKRRKVLKKKTKIDKCTQMNDRVYLENMNEREKRAKDREREI